MLILGALTDDRYTMNLHVLATNAAVCWLMYILLANQTQGN